MPRVHKQGLPTWRSNSSALLDFFETGFLWLELDPWVVLIVHPSLADYIGSDFTKKGSIKRNQNWIYIAHIQSMNLMFSLASSTETIPTLHCIVCLAQEHFLPQGCVVFLGSISFFFDEPTENTA